MMMTDTNILTATISSLIILTVFCELINISENINNKVLYFADDVNKAMDCAIQGIPISKCTTFKNNFNDTDLKEYTKFLETKIKELESELNNIVNSSTNVTTS